MGSAHGEGKQTQQICKENADFIRIFTAGVKTVEVDKAGRIQISKDLVTFAKLEKEIVLTSAGDFFEIWDKEAYENVISGDLENFAILAEEVMGANSEEQL